MEVDLVKYEERIEALFKVVPSFQRVGRAGYNPGLETMVAFDDFLGNPHRKFRVIHVAGTNGKGSVSSMLASVLMGLGYRVGLYTSPHLVDFRERVKVDGEMIGKGAVLEFLERCEGFVAEYGPSFFEITTAMAFDYFAACGVDYAVVECGLGGRLDSTNIVTPVLSVITSIGLDHTDILGDTLEKVAYEKGGIIKGGVPVVVGEVTESVAELLRGIADERGADIYCAQYVDGSPEMLAGKINPSHTCGAGPSHSRCHGRHVFPLPTSQVEDILSRMDLKGDYQRSNLMTVLTSLNVMADTVADTTNGHENGSSCDDSFSSFRDDSFPSFRGLTAESHDGYESGHICAQTAVEPHNGHENTPFRGNSFSSFRGLTAESHDGHKNSPFCAQTAVESHDGHESGHICAQTAVESHDGHKNSPFCAQTAVEPHDGHESGHICAQISAESQSADGDTPEMLAGKINPSHTCGAGPSHSRCHGRHVFPLPTSQVEDILSRMDLKGDYQRSNLMTVLTSLNVMADTVADTTNGPENGSSCDDSFPSFRGLTAESHNGHKNSPFCAQTAVESHDGHESGHICAQISAESQSAEDDKISGGEMAQSLHEIGKGQFAPLGSTSIIDSICHAAERTGFRGRWEVLSEHPFIVCDIAHNPHGMGPVMEQLKRVYQEAVTGTETLTSDTGDIPRLFILFGVMGDKDLESISDYLPHQAYYFYTAADSPRAMYPYKLSEWMSDHGFIGEVTPGVAEAVKKCLSQVSEKDIVYIGGSSYVVAEALKLF